MFHKIRIWHSILGTAVLLLIPTFSIKAQQMVNNIQKNKLILLSQQLSERNISRFRAAIDRSLKNKWQANLASVGGASLLIGVDPLGFPVYLKTCDNTISAATTETNRVQPGGDLNLNLSGSSNFMKNKLAMWDEGIALATHQEFAGKVISTGDNAVNITDHSTHVAGTMLAKGVYLPAKGMSFGALTLQTFDFNNDEAEMAAAAPQLLISNHSYGYNAGWFYDNGLNRWEWDGLPGDTVDYKFGFYSEDALIFDEIAFNAQKYLIVQAAGNAHSQTGPPVGSDYYGYKSATDATLVDEGSRSALLSNNDSYDVIAGSANAKNILTVGAVNPLPDGPTSAAAVQIAPFSSWGPTDDGRIKPDICGNGVNVLSTGSATPASYIMASGTSTATPNVSGSLFLLQEYYAQLNAGDFMRSATLKGLVCHTAFDAGNPGPDYIYGWGVLNTAAAAQVITRNGKDALIGEMTLAQGETQSFTAIAQGNQPMVATISWTDPEGSLSAYGTVNDRTPKLVNDLDSRITDGTNNYQPWVLDPEHPALNAIKGDNFRDNIEQVVVSNPVPGQSYSIIVNHKRRLLYGFQNYSIIVTGVAQVYLDELVPDDISLIIYPVPAFSELNVSLNSPAPGNLSLAMFNSLGQKVYQHAKMIDGGAYLLKISTQTFPAGVYVMRAQFDNKIINKKITIVK